MAPVEGPLGGIICCSFRGLSSLNVHIVDSFLVVVSHYVLHYNDHYHHHSTCDCCLLWSIPHHHSGYTFSHLCGPDNNGSTRYGFVTKVDSRLHLKVFCCPHVCAASTSITVPGAFSGYTSYAGPLQVSFPFSASSVICLVFVMVFTFCFLVPMCCAMVTFGGSVFGICDTTTLQSLPLAGICAS